MFVNLPDTLAAFNHLFAHNTSSNEAVQTRRAGQPGTNTTFKNAEKSTPTMLCLNAGSAAKLVVGGNQFQTLTTILAKN